MRCETCKAPAKLNLHLGVYPQLDERGYHRVDSLMVAVDVFDEVRLAEREDNGMVHVCCEPQLSIPEECNTAYRAAALMAECAGRPASVDISLVKHVPDQAGMGGSSSDAAAVISLLCSLWGLDVRDEQVQSVARRVGADVPFFLSPVPTLLVGAGDVVAEQFPSFAHPIPVALVRPQGPGVSTPAAYAAFDELHEDPADPEPLCATLRSGCATGKTIAGLLANNLDSVACRLLPGVAEVRRWLLAQEGVLGGQVTGSGSCVFAICTNDEAAQWITREARKKFGGWAKAAHIT